MYIFFSPVLFMSYAFRLYLSAGNCCQSYAFSPTFQKIWKPGRFILQDYPTNVHSYSLFQVKVRLLPAETCRSFSMSCSFLFQDPLWWFLSAGKENSQVSPPADARIPYTSSPCLFTFSSHWNNVRSQNETITRQTAVISEWIELFQQYHHSIISKCCQV